MIVRTQDGAIVNLATAQWVGVRPWVPGSDKETCYRVLAVFADRELSTIGQFATREEAELTLDMIWDRWRNADGIESWNFKKGGQG